jgi:hypothetical protein
VRHLSEDSGSGNVKQQDNADKSDTYAAAKMTTWQNKTLFQTLKYMEQIQG